MIEFWAIAWQGDASPQRPADTKLEVIDNVFFTAGTGPRLVSIPGHENSLHVYVHVARTRAAGTNIIRKSAAARNV